MSQLTGVKHRVKDDGRAVVVFGQALEGWNKGGRTKKKKKRGREMTLMITAS